MVQLTPAKTANAAMGNVFATEDLDTENVNCEKSSDKSPVAYMKLNSPKTPATLPRRKEPKTPKTPRSCRKVAKTANPRRKKLLGDDVGVKSPEVFYTKPADNKCNGEKNSVLTNCETDDSLVESSLDESSSGNISNTYTFFFCLRKDLVYAES